MLYICLMRRAGIEDFLNEAKTGLLLDVRSPAEFAHAHIPGAINLPLFSDEERKEVGTTYKQVSRKEAIKLGLDYFGPKMKVMVEEVEKLVCARQLSADDKAPLKTDCQPSTTNSVFVYCWRGGMRSAAVAWLLDLYGFRTMVLQGGYKSFRTSVLQSFETKYPFCMLGGYTGSGKTEMLYRLKEAGAHIIDLEQLASHKGSAFGNINMPPQPSQEMFENLLSLELVRAYKQIQQQENPCDDDDYENASTNNICRNCIWLEDESQRIGHINLPMSFWNNMRSSPLYFLELPFEDRLQHIVEEYSTLDKERMLHAIGRIQKRLGGLDAKIASAELEAGNIEACFRILLRYYDKQYEKGLQNRDKLDELLTRIPNSSSPALLMQALLQPGKQPVVHP